MTTYKKFQQVSVTQMGGVVSHDHHQYLSQTTDRKTDIAIA